MRISDWSSDVCSSDLEEGQVLVRDVVAQHPLAQLVAGSLDEVAADQVAGTPGTRVQHHPDGLALVQADLDEVVAAAERAQLLVHLVDPDLRVPGLAALQPLPQAGVGQGRLDAVGHLARSEGRGGGKECVGTWSTWGCAG